MTWKLALPIGAVALLIVACKPPDPIRHAPFRGFMIDAPRTVETPEYYRRLIDFCQKKGLNSIIFRLTDDQGSAYRFQSHPELLTCAGAYTAQELRELVKYARSKGVEMIPEVESFGHAKYIIGSQRYKFLDDGPKGKEFNAICPVSDSSLLLMKDLYTEVAGIFTSKYFHIGCDEVDWGASDLSQSALRQRSRHAIWATYVNTLNGYIKALGKTTIIWGDVPIYHEHEVLDLLDKDIVIMDWNYWETRKETVDSIAGTISRKGFRMIGCPAVNWCRWGPRVGEEQFGNINAYAEVYCNLPDPNNLGIFLSNWVPLRYIQNSQWDTYTIAAKILENKGNYNYMDALPDFVKMHFNAAWDTNWEKIYRTVYEKTPQSFCAQDDDLKFLPWSDSQDIRNIIGKGEPVDNPYNGIRQLLLQYKDRIKENKEDFDDFLLTIDFMAYNYDRQNSLLTLVHSGKTDPGSVETYVRKVAAQDSIFMARINTAWARGRRSDPLEKQTERDYMLSFNKASNFSKELRGHPAELIKILHTIAKI